MIQQLMRQKELNYEEQANKIFGVVTAVVTNTKDPDKKGRIKVKYVWMGEAKAIESDWARVVSFMAGNGRGAHFLPDVDDEVLVAFEHGNINSPYVVGALYNAKDKVIEKNEDGKNNIKMLKSRCGHTVTLDDTSGKEKIIIQDKDKKRFITFDTEKKSLTIQNDDTGDIVIKAKGNIKVDSEKNIEITGKAGIKIKSDGDVNIEGKNVNLKSSMAFKINSGSSLSAKSSAGTTISAGSTMGIKASASGKFEAPKLEFSASAMGTFKAAKLDLNGSAMSTLQSSGITTVKGSLVKVN